VQVGRLAGYLVHHCKDCDVVLDIGSGLVRTYFANTVTVTMCCVAMKGSNNHVTHTVCSTMNNAHYTFNNGHQL